MVGTVIFKNFETGSYREIRLTAYGGKAYADIGKGEFFSCRVCLDTRCINYEFISSDDIGFRSMTDILFVAQKAREYLYEHPWVTVAEFSFDGGEVNLRPLSFKCGVSEPVDFKALFTGKGFYKLVGETPDKSPMWRSVLCEGLNFGVHRAFDVSESIYFFAGYGVYVNLSVFDAKSLAKLTKELSVANRKLALRKTCHRLPGKLSPRRSCGERAPVSDSVGGLSNVLARYRTEVSSYMTEKLGKTVAKGGFASRLVTFAGDDFICSLTDEATRELRDFASCYYDYGYVSAKSHIDMLTVRECRLLAIDPSLTEKISSAAKARSSNMKLLTRLPCPAFCCSDGTAIWE